MNPSPLFKLSQLPLLSADPILKLPIEFKKDPRIHKVNLGVGAYRDAQGAPWILPSVQEAEKRLLHCNKEYLPIEGESTFIALTECLLFNNAVPAHCFSAQTPGGSAALRIGAELLKKAFVHPLIFLSNPTWPNHQQIFNEAGFRVEFYPYFDQNRQQLSFQLMLEAITQMPPESIIMLQACAHNPTGIDPTQQEWELICDRIKKQRLIPFFDVAYQGFGENLHQDIYPITLFLSHQIECLVSYSFSKNMGLYGERIGMLSVCVQGEGILSQIRRIIRTMYSSPPLHGALIVKTILSDPILKELWQREVDLMRHRIHAMRTAFAKATGMDFMLNQKGMFSYTGLSKEQVKRLAQEFAIYLPDDGRINFAGLTTAQIDCVSQAIQAVQ